MGGREYLICLFSRQTLSNLQNLPYHVENLQYSMMSMKDGEEITQTETCSVKTLATLSLSVSITSLVIASVVVTLMTLSYMSESDHVTDHVAVPDLCNIPPDPGPCTSSVNRQVFKLMKLVANLYLI